MKPVVSILARRFLTGRKQSSFLSFISGISLFGVALGVAALLVVMAVMEGFETKLRSLITGTRSHITLYSSRNIILNRQQLVDQLQEKFPGEIESVSPFVFSEVMLAHKGRVVGSVLEGIEADGIARTTDIVNHISNGDLPVAAVFSEEESVMATIVLGSVIAEELAAKIGSVVSVISPYFDKGTMQPRARRFRVSGILSTGMYEYDSKYSMVDAAEARKFFRLPAKSASALRIKTTNAALSFELAHRIKAAFGYPYVTRDWTELNRNLLYAIKLQKIVIFIVLVSIIVVAAFNIMSTLVIMMDEKKKDMSILKAMGLAPNDSAKVFAIVGLLIGGSGAVFGVALGVAISQVIANTQLIHLPPDIYFISYLPIDMRFSTLMVVMLAALTVSLLATLYPSWRVRVESPIEGLRYE